jgi:hypothetical protein
VDKVDPERELIRRVLPFALPAVFVAFVAGMSVSGWNSGLSAAIGVAVVLLNFIVHGRSVAWAARISLTALYAVALGGFVLRLAAIAVIIFALDRLPVFSPLAFVLSVVPAMVLLIAFELRQLQGVMQGDLWRFPREPAQR